MTGVELKNDALDKQENRHGDFLREARRALVRTVLERGSGTADDVRAVLGKLPDGMNPNALGTVPRALLRAGVIEFAGYQASERAARRANPNRVWRLADRDKATAWLAAN